MTFTVIDVPQRSPEWYAARLGRVTGSRAADLLRKGKGSEEAAGRRNLRMDLVLERMNGKPSETTFQSAAMQQGIEREAGALAAYEALTGRVTHKSGFLSCDGVMAGCSLDGHVGDFDGIVEAKSPIAATHADYLETGKVPGDYHKQMVHGLWVTGARWCDWLSFNPDFPEGLQVKLVRVERNDAEIADYEKAVVAFLATVERKIELLHTLSDLRGQLQAAVA